MISKQDFIIGIDFDNTIVCYDDIFYQVALEKKMIPAHIPKNKESVRDYLRKAGKEDLWTEMQGYVYGARMSDAHSFPGVFKCIHSLSLQNIPVFIISHKTRYPYKGKAYDLHASARTWLEANGISESGNLGISMDSVFFMETKQEKLTQISECRCTHFIDDLPEFLSEPNFPVETKKILFSHAPKKVRDGCDNMLQFDSWNKICTFLLSNECSGK